MGEDDLETGDGTTISTTKDKYFSSSATMNNQIPPQYKPLTLIEKKFLLAVERGDLASVRR